jgi:3-(3-hydroxy-phenyl)propionate hydroxylase
MRVVLSTYGSRGDVEPMAGFAVQLRTVGAEVRVLGLWQNHIERILADWVGELAVTIYRERDVTGFAQDDTGVDVALSDGQSLRAEYLVGCDGGRSLIRKAAGIEFPGWDPTTNWLIAEVEMAEEPACGFRRLMAP